MARGVCVSLEYDTTSRGKKSTWVIFDTPSLCSLRLRWNTRHQKVSHVKCKSATGTNVCCHEQDKNTSVFVKMKHNAVCMRSTSLQWRKLTWEPFAIIKYSCWTSRSCCWEGLQMGERNSLLVSLLTCNQILFHTIITMTFCQLRGVHPQPVIHRCAKGTVGLNQDGSGLPNVQLGAITEPLTGKLGNFHKERHSPFHRSH